MESLVGRGARRGTWRAGAIGMLALALTGVGVVGVTPARASSTIAVTTLTDEATVNGHCSLREALKAADTDQVVDTCKAGSGVDTITVPAGTIKLLLGELTAHSDVSVVGAGTAAGAGTFIDGGGPGVAVRGFHAIAPARLSVSELTVQHTYTAFRNDATLTLSNVHVTANGFDSSIESASTYAASGLDNRGIATVTSALLSGNGDLVDRWSSPHLINNPLNHSLHLLASTLGATAPNVAFNDPAVESSGTMTIKNTTFNGVIATHFDATGGLELANHGTATLSFVSFGRSSADIGGNAVDNDGKATLDHVTISSDFGGITNRATMGITNTTLEGNVGTGGLITNENSGHLQMATTTISGNSSAQNAAMLVNRGTSILVNVTIANNEATPYFDGFGPQGAGGIDNAGTLTGRNLTVTDNTFDAFDTSGSDPMESGGLLNRPGALLNLANSVVAGNRNLNSSTPAPDCKGRINSLGYDLVQRTLRCTLAGTLTGTITGTAPLLNALANNGGFTQTRLPKTGSPVIDKGNPAAPSTATANCPLFDQRSISRPRDGDGNGTSRCDIGSVEK
jgi:CSLREA domain-containing protein